MKIYIYTCDGLIECFNMVKSVGDGCRFEIIGYNYPVFYLESSF